MGLNEVSRATIGRLPQYLTYLETSEEVSKLPGATISAAAMARNLGLGEVQVRKDLSAIAGAGRPKIGFEVADLISSLKKYIGSDNPEAAVVVGAGRLGSAILNYRGFTSFGIEVIAAFDRKSSEKGDSHIMPLTEMKSYCTARNIDIAILTVSDEACQEVCNMMVDAGISKILNFTQVRPTVPSGVIVEQINIALSLAALKHSGK